MELLEFYADWCGPCQMMMPVVDEFEKAHPEIKVTRKNVDEDEALAEEYGVYTIPCFIFLKDGKEIKREEGMISMKKLEKVIGA